MPEPSSIGPIRPGYIERGIAYARKAAYADGYRVGRAGGPIPHRRDVYPYAKRWITGYIDGELDRREYDHAVTESAAAGASRPADGPRGASHDGPLGCVVGRSAAGGARSAAGVPDHGRREVGRSGGVGSGATRQGPIPPCQKVA